MLFLVLWDDLLCGGNLEQGPSEERQRLAVSLDFGEAHEGWTPWLRGGETTGKRPRLDCDAEKSLQEKRTPIKKDVRAQKRCRQNLDLGAAPVTSSELE